MDVRAEIPGGTNLLDDDIDEVHAEEEGSEYDDRDGHDVPDGVLVDFHGCCCL